MHTVFALLCFVVVIHWLIFPYPSDLLHWHCGNLTIAPVPAKQPWWIWINTSCEFIMNDCITTTKQSTTKPCAYFLGYTVCMCCRPTAWAIDPYDLSGTMGQNLYTSCNFTMQYMHTLYAHYLSHWLNIPADHNMHLEHMVSTKLLYWITSLRASNCIEISNIWYVLGTTHPQGFSES